MPDTPSVFLSYTSADRSRVVPYFEHLKSAGFNVWMDTTIKGGQNWDFEIQQALKKASLIVCFFSSGSLNRRGYVQREIKIALDFASEKLESDIFLIQDDRNKEDIRFEFLGRKIKCYFYFSLNISTPV